MKKALIKNITAVLLILATLLSVASCSVVDLVEFFGADDRERAKAMLYASEDAYRDGYVQSSSGKITVSANNRILSVLNTSSTVKAKMTDGGIEHSVVSEVYQGHNKLYERSISYDNGKVTLLDGTLPFGGSGECSEDEYGAMLSAFGGGTSSIGSTVESFEEIEITESDGKITLTLNGARNPAANPYLADSFEFFGAKHENFAITELSLTYVLSAKDYRILSSSYRVTTENAVNRYSTSSSTTFRPIENGESAAADIAEQKEYGKIAASYSVIKAYSELKNIKAADYRANEIYDNLSKGAGYKREVTVDGYFENFGTKILSEPGTAEERFSENYFSALLEEKEITILTQKDRPPKTNIDKHMIIDATNGEASIYTYDDDELYATLSSDGYQRGYYMNLDSRAFSGFDELQEITVSENGKEILLTFGMSEKDMDRLPSIFDEASVTKRMTLKFSSYGSLTEVRYELIAENSDGDYYKYLHTLELREYY